MCSPAPAPGSRAHVVWDRLIALLNHRGFQIASLLCYALFLNREGVKVPSGNELVYLLYVFKAWHPHLLAADWTFQETTAGHGFFNLTIGWLTLLMPLEKAAWVGRFTCWTLSFIALLRLGSNFNIPRWTIWLGIMLWMIERQALPIALWTEWIVGSFEAKCPAYICLLFALDAALRQRPLVAGLLTGLAFSFHTAVGMWGGAAIGWAILTQLPLRATLMFCVSAFVTAIPGLVSSLKLVFGTHQIHADEARFLVTVAEPLMLNPYAFSPACIALLVLMLVFAGAYRLGRTDRVSRMLFQFELMLGIFFAAGFLARVAGWFGLLKLFPMRVFTVLAMLLFFWQLGVVCADMLRQPRSAGGQRFVLVFGAILFLALPSPVTQLVLAVGAHIPGFHGPGGGQQVDPDADPRVTADFRTAAKWVSQNTPEDALIIAPPWRSDEFYYIRRPLVASWNAYRYDQMNEWRRRIERLVGDISHMDACYGTLDMTARAHYRNLSVADIASLQNEFKATWFVTTTPYPYREAFSCGTYRVYELPQSPENR